MKYLCFALIVFIYVLLGIQLEQIHAIVKPSNWSLYGVFFGSILTTIGMSAIKGEGNE